MSLTDGERRTQDLASDCCLWGPAPGDFSGLCYPSAPAASPGMHPGSASGPKSEDGTESLSLLSSALGNGFLITSHGTSGRHFAQWPFGPVSLKV